MGKKDNYNIHTVCNHGANYYVNDCGCTHLNCVVLYHYYAIKMESVKNELCIFVFVHILCVDSDVMFMVYLQNISIAVEIKRIPPQHCPPALDMGGINCGVHDSPQH